MISLIFPGMYFLCVFLCSCKRRKLTQSWIPETEAKTTISILTYSPYKFFRSERDLNKLQFRNKNDTKTVL